MAEDCYVLLAAGRVQAVSAASGGSGCVLGTAVPEPLGIEVEKEDEDDHREEDDDGYHHYLTCKLHYSRVG